MNLSSLRARIARLEKARREAARRPPHVRGAIDETTRCARVAAIVDRPDGSRRHARIVELIELAKARRAAALADALH